MDNPKKPISILDIVTYLLRGWWETLSQKEAQSNSIKVFTSNDYVKFSTNI